MTSASTWGNSEFHSETTFSASLIRKLLQQMMVQFNAHGACIALFDESENQMCITCHIRVRNVASLASGQLLEPGVANMRVPRRRVTLQLQRDESEEPHRGEEFDLPEVEDVTPQQSELFAVGECYTRGQDAIGRVWQRNEAFLMTHDEYLSIFHRSYGHTPQVDVTPSAYLVVPVQEVNTIELPESQNPQPQTLGIIVLYQLEHTGGAVFQARQRHEALQYAERVALYLQNDRLQRAQRRTGEYLQRLQDISTAFPTNVKLYDLIEDIYRFASQMVDVSSLQLTLYDRDTVCLYDVFAIENGQRCEELLTNPTVSTKEARPIWWDVAQVQKESLQFSPAQEPALVERYGELLRGAWGDQSQAESFVFLPMKMFNRVTGSLSLASPRTSAYPSQEVQVLETMIQIVTVSIENAKLYERDRHLLRDAKQREAQLAAINSTLQTITSVLDINELLNGFVEKVASLVDVELCVFFQLSPTHEELVAEAMYGRPSVSLLDDGSGRPAIEPPHNKEEHEALTRMIRLPFRETFLEPQIRDEAFFYLNSERIEELAQHSNEGGIFFLHAIPAQQLLMIPMFYQEDFIGLLSVSLPKEGRTFKPKDVGMLLAICAQAASAIRNAQLFSEREEAYAELQRMDKLKDEFLVTASHELRTPMSAIIGYSSLLKRQSSRIGPSDILRFATKISTAAQQLHDLVENMTEAAKMGAVDKKLELKPEVVQVRSVAEMAASTLLLSIEQRIKLPIDERLWVRADAVHLRQVVQNLLDNASKYSPAKSEIVVTAEEDILSHVAEKLPEGSIDHMTIVEQGNAPVIVIQVRDQGEGILPEDQQRIFDKFVRAPRSLTTPVRGSGLGLYISRRYVEAMGGKLWLESSGLNEGSVFAFYLLQVEPPAEAGE
ncbi:hypothetical protein KSD_25640 [Ktedonobacter sp. SOSP1-85]|uniref:sensor histidine kinase n=1 Tax=Ktedonobacter sp. SOSP1-85 TaxID=2778367 RepID=UPI001916BB8E|nr:GAF domain-containing sensor histidine kinase [Ktedonobacter sp. SOSP1-85]GHO74793.1 hypothetical protein KSD_25640 [Ktedonobacter sp. SOSP1-85]